MLSPGPCIDRARAHHVDRRPALDAAVDRVVDTEPLCGAVDVQPLAQLEDDAVVEHEKSIMLVAITLPVQVDTLAGDLLGDQAQLLVALSGL